MNTLKFCDETEQKREAGHAFCTASPRPAIDVIWITKARGTSADRLL